MSEAYAQKTHGFATRPSSRLMLEKLMLVLDLAEGSSILDVGCGTGVAMIQLADRYKMQGLDVNPAACLQAVEKGLDVQLYAGASFPSSLCKDFDAVLLTNTLNHVADFYVTLFNAYASLKPGGQLGVINPSPWYRLAMQRKNRRSHYKDDQTLQRLTSRRQLHRGVEEMFVNARTIMTGEKLFGISPNIILTARKPWK